MNPDDFITESGDGVFLRCRIHPSAPGNTVKGVLGNALKISLSAPPVDGKANKALCTFIAGKLKIPKSSVKIVSGEKSRSKTVFCKNIRKREAVQILL